MSFEDGFSNEEDGKRGEEIEFYEELERLATSAEFRPFAIVLMNGGDVVIDQQSELSVLTAVFSVDRADGSSIMFPPYNVCAIRILSDR